MPRTNATTPVGVKQLREPIGAERERARKLPIRELAYLVLKLNVVRQLAFAAILTSALFVSGAQLSATGCPVASAPIAKACQMGCCANKCCCADSEKNHNLPPIPAAKDSVSNYGLAAVLASSSTMVNFPFQPVELRLDFSATSLRTSVPRPALLCTFLI